MRTPFLFLAASVALCSNSVAAKDYVVGHIQIGQPWTRVSPKGAPLVSAYLRITNHGTEPDRAICVSVTVAAKCEIQTVTVEQGIAKMRPASDGLEIKPGETIELKPGASHLMLVGLKQPLEKGKTIKGTLKFEKAGSIEVEFLVEDIGASSPATRG
jgi:periplasmic copper chaperone A